MEEKIYLKDLTDKSIEIMLKSMDYAQIELDGCSDNEIATTLLMTIWGIKKAIEIQIGEDEVERILKEIDSELEIAED